MTKTLFDYPVSDAYGATYSPWSPAKPHLGDDRAAPGGTPILVSGVNIGYVGKSGAANGYHTHVQLRNSNGTIVNPRKGGGSISGKVSRTGYNDERGYFVDIKEDNGQTWAYFHMEGPASVSIGQTIGGNMPSLAKEVDVKRLYLGILGRAATAQEIKDNIGTELSALIGGLMDSPERLKYAARVQEALSSDANTKLSAIKEIVK